jgi:preprotein translocase subunit SecF
MMFKGIKFIPDDTKFDFIGHALSAYIISAIIVFGSLGLIATKGLNFGIDFTGGTLIEIRMPDAPDLSKMREDLNNLEIGDVSLQEFGAPNDILIRLPQQQGDETAQQVAIDKVRATLNANYENLEYRRTEFVGPQVGDELKRDAMYAVIFSIIGIMGYIWFRFEWQFGVSSLVALFHDVIGTVGLFALTGMPFDLTSLAAVLMVAGYSINDTVVIFDRIRETLLKYRKKPMPEIVNIAINATLSRTVMTGCTTLMALAALWIFGGEVIQGFVISLVFGIIIGTHSSIFVAAPLLLYMNVRPKQLKESN